jgi:hypothetical protein
LTFLVSAVHQDAAANSMELVARPVGRQDETKAGLWAVWADPALVPGAAICSLDGFTNRALQEFPINYCLSAVPHWLIWVIQSGTGNNPILTPT